MDVSETAEIQRTRGLRRVALIAVVTLGDPGLDRSRHLCHRIRDLVAHDRVTGGPSADMLIMVTSRYPLAATTKTGCDSKEKDASLTKDKLIRKRRNH